MQRPITDDIHLGQTVNPADNTNAARSVDYVANFKKITENVDRLQGLMETCVMNDGWWFDKISTRHGWISLSGYDYNSRTKKIPANSTYKNCQTLEFNRKLPVNQYMNWNNVLICLPIQIKSKTTPANGIDPAMITVNNFFAHWIKEIDIKQYEDDLQILPTGNSTQIKRVWKHSSV